MKIAIIKYNAGNITSLNFAVQRLGVETIITDNENEINNADKVIFPGVGEASTTMKYLKEKGLDTIIKNLKQPVLGICLGMQLMCSYSEEGNTECINIFDEKVKKFQQVKHNEIIKIPHTGWNTINNLKSNLFSINLNNQYVYFVHSYYVPICKETTAETNYILPFSSALKKNNFYATQFHPEKSGSIGQNILKNWLFYKGT